MSSLIPISIEVLFDLNEFFVLSDSVFKDTDKCCYVLNLLSNFALNVLKHYEERAPEQVNKTTRTKQSILHAAIKLFETLSREQLIIDLQENSANALCIKECLLICVQTVFHNALGNIIINECKEKKVEEFIECEDYKKQD